MNLYLQRANYAKSRISSEINLHVQFCYTDLHSSSLPACAYLLIVAPKARLGIYIRQYSNLADSAAIGSTMTEPKTPLTGVISRRKTHSKQTDRHARIVSKKIPEIIKALKAKNQEQAFKLYQSIKVSRSSDTLLRNSDSLFLFLQTSYKYNDDNF